MKIKKNKPKLNKQGQNQYESQNTRKIITKKKTNILERVAGPILKARGS